jgi:hypothetical protein
VLAFINIWYIFRIICRADESFDSLDRWSVLTKDDDDDPNYLLKHQQVCDAMSPSMSYNMGDAQGLHSVHLHRIF